MSVTLFLPVGHQRAADNLLHPGRPQPGIDRLLSAGNRKHQRLCFVRGNQRGHKGRTYQAGDRYHSYPAPSAGTAFVPGWRLNFDERQQLQSHYLQQPVSSFTHSLFLQVSDLSLDEGSSLPLTTDIIKVANHHFSDMNFLYQVMDPPRYGHLEHSRIPGMPITAFTHTEV